MTMRPLTPELAEQARVELNEDPNRIASDLQNIKDWLSKQPHIRACTDDQWLVAFLRGCKYSLERTKEKLDLYYSLRTLAPELYNTRHDDPNFYEFMKIGSFLILPLTVTPTSPRTVVVRPGTINNDTQKMVDFCSVVTLCQKILLFDDDRTVVSGIQWIVDMRDVTIGHLVQITPSLIRKMVYGTQEATPLRMKGTHYVNVPSAFGKILNTMKNFLNEKNKNRLYVHRNYEELYEKIPRRILPREYGGDSASINEIIEDWVAKKQKYDSWLEQDMKNGTDESKRPGQPKTAEALFGVEGSFRQLDFD